MKVRTLFPVLTVVTIAISAATAAHAAIVFPDSTASVGIAGSAPAAETLSFATSTADNGGDLLTGSSIPVPEPLSCLLVGSAGAGLCLLRRRRV